MDPITTITGPIDAASFNNGATAVGTKVLAEITQNTTKINEIVGGLTVVAADLDVEEAARGAADSALDVRMDAEEAATAANTAYHLFNDGYLQTTDVRLDALEQATASGYVEVAVGNKTLAADTEHTINFTGTAGYQLLVLPATMTDFSLGMNWVAICNNADGLMIAPSAATAWAHESLTTLLDGLYLRVGDQALITAVDVGTTKKWSAAVLRGDGGTRSAAAGAGDLGGTDQDDRIIWVDRTGDTGTRDYYLPDLTAGDALLSDGREITLVLYGTATSGTFVVHTLGTGDVFNSGLTSFTMTEKSTCRFIGNVPPQVWAVIKGAA